MYNVQCTYFKYYTQTYLSTQFLWKLYFAENIPELQFVCLTDANF